MAAGNQWKHREFTLALSTRLLSLLNLKNIHIDASLKILVTRPRKHKANRFRALNTLPRNKANLLI